MKIIHILLENSGKTFYLAAISSFLSGASSAGVIAVINYAIANLSDLPNWLLWLFISLCLILWIFRYYLKLLEIEHKVTVRDGVLSTTHLSQGQRKRLALLTAYLEDRPIYIFDEWASDQDPVFKEVFYKQLLPELKSRGKTVIAVSHDDRYFEECVAKPCRRLIA